MAARLAFRYRFVRDIDKSFIDYPGQPCLRTDFTITCWSHSQQGRHAHASPSNGCMARYLLKWRVSLRDRLLDRRPDALPTISYSQETFSD